jgi:hypothetical protein
MARAAVVLNAAITPRFSPAERERLGAVKPPLNALAQPVLALEQRAEQSARFAARLDAELGLPRIDVPLLFVERFGRPAVEKVADALEDR